MSALWQGESAPVPEGHIGELPFSQKAVALALAVFMIVVVLELVRRRKLREEYSFLWFGTAVVLLALALEPQLLNLFKDAIGAEMPTSALFFGALCFLMAVSLQFSVRLTRLTFRAKSLTQKVALLEDEVRQLRRQLDEPRESP